MADTSPERRFGWPAIVRLGLVQGSIGAVVVLATSTLNRIMAVELALPALLPGFLVAFHYLVQVLRPRMGHGSDVGGRRTPWIVGGMGVLAAGGVVAACGVAFIPVDRTVGIALALAGFTMIGLGVSASGTSLLALLARRVDADRRASAATAVWLMMIVGFAVTAGVAGRLLDPYSSTRLLEVSAGVSLTAFVVTMVAVAGIEGRGLVSSKTLPVARTPSRSFGAALSTIWADADARRFTFFIFVSMLAYSAQDLILEPFAGKVFAFTPGESTALSGVLHGGVFAGMLIATIAGRRWRGRSTGTLRAWTMAGCAASACALCGLVAASLVGPSWPFRPTVFVLGAANGIFSIAAIGSMMRLARSGGDVHVGARMGLWGAAQAVAFGMGGLIGTGASDLARWVFGAPDVSYATVFAFEGLLFVAAAWLAAGVSSAEAVDDVKRVPSAAPPNPGRLPMSAPSGA